MATKDTKIHYTNTPFLPDFLTFMGKTTATMCGRRRNVEMVSSAIRNVTCTLCRGCAYEYHIREIESIRKLLQDYDKNNGYKGTEFEKEIRTMIPKLLDSLTYHQDVISRLMGR
jgi:hypothetical protein